MAGEKEKKPTAISKMEGGKKKTPIQHENRHLKSGDGASAGGQEGRQKLTRVEATREHPARARAEASAGGAKPQQRNPPNARLRPEILAKARKEPRVSGNATHPSPVTTEGFRAQEGIRHSVTVPARYLPKNQLHPPPSALRAEFPQSGFSLCRSRVNTQTNPLASRRPGACSRAEEGSVPLTPCQGRSPATPLTPTPLPAPGQTLGGCQPTGSRAFKTSLHSKRWKKRTKTRGTDSDSPSFQTRPACPAP